MLATVRSSLSEHVGEGAPTGDEAPPEQFVYTEEAGGWDNDANEMVFDDSGEGVGVEGDLDVEDD